MSKHRRTRRSKRVSFAGISLPAVAIPAVLGALGIGGYLLWKRKQTGGSTSSLPSGAMTTSGVREISASGKPATAVTGNVVSTPLGTRVPASFIPSPDVAPKPAFFIQPAKNVSWFVNTPAANFKMPTGRDASYNTGEYENDRQPTSQAIVNSVLTQAQKDDEAGLSDTEPQKWRAGYYYQVQRRG